LSLFITFEGGEGCGKSTQAEKLFRTLREASLPAVKTFEPGGTRLGRKVRPTLVSRQLKMQLSPMTELFLFAASRAQLVTEIIRPNLDGEKIVICDRFTDSTLAYQGYGRGIDLKTIDTVNTLATGGLKPDLVILLDLPPQIGLARHQGSKLGRFEQEGLAFHKRIRDGYLKLAAKEPERWLVIDGTLPKAKIGKIIWEKVSQLLSSKGYL